MNKTTTPADIAAIVDRALDRALDELRPVFDRLSAKLDATTAELDASRRRCIELEAARDKAEARLADFDLVADAVDENVLAFARAMSDSIN